MIRPLFHAIMIDNSTMVSRRLEAGIQPIHRICLVVVENYVKKSRQSYGQNHRNWLLYTDLDHFVGVNKMVKLPPLVHLLARHILDSYL